MKRLLLVLATLAIATSLPACHDHDRRDDHAHTTTTTTETTSTHIAPTAASSTTVQTY